MPSFVCSKVVLKLKHSVWESGCIPPHILNFGNRWKWVVSFIL